MQFINKLCNDLYELTLKLASYVPTGIIDIPLRISIFLIFWNSAQTKIDGLTVFGQHLAFWSITDTTVFLFENEYALPLIPPVIAAYMATLAEFFLAIGIILGIFTRLNALGLLIITAVIQIFVYPETWQEHLVWAGMLLVLFKQGSGILSVDHFLKK